MRAVSKKTSRREYNIQQKLYKLIPKYVPKPLSYTKGVMKSKKCGTSLKKWLKSHPRVTDCILMQIIRNVRLILSKIRRKYPGFRHMDLHIDNVLMNNGRVMIVDFGMSKFKTTKDMCYDFHLFLNSMRNFLLKRGRRVKYLNKVLPEGFRGSHGKYVSNFRMKSSESAASIAKRLMGLRA